MKVSVVLAVVVVALLINNAYAAIKCVSVDPVCVKTGGNCSSDASLCEYGTRCNYNFTTEQATCVKRPGVGEYCDSFHECANNDYVICYNNTCQSKTWEQKVGEVCNNLHNCRNELFCNGTICLAPAAKGENCTDHMPCGTNLGCNSGKCIEVFSVPEGGPCDFFSYDPSVLCGADLYCKYNVSINTATCVAGFASSNKPCNTTCDNTEESCRCNDDGQAVCTAPLTFTSSQISAIKNLESCVSDTNCNRDDPAKCCNRYQCDVKFILNDKDTYKKNQKVFSSCGFSDPLAKCETFWGRASTGVKVGIIVGAVAFVVIVAALVVFFVKRNRGYSRIN